MRVLSTTKIEMMTPQVNYAAIVGSIPCGTPEEKEAQIEEYLPLSVSVFGSGSFYILRASGNSVIEAQIDDGDFVINFYKNYKTAGCKMKLDT